MTRDEVVSIRREPAILMLVASISIIATGFLILLRNTFNLINQINAGVDLLINKPQIMLVQLLTPSKGGYLEYLC